MKNLQQLAQEVWSKQHLGEKKEILVDMVLSFDHKGNAPKFLHTIANMTRLDKADSMAANLALNNTDAVIK